MKHIKFAIKNLPPQPRNSSHTLRKTNRGGKDIHFMGKTEVALMFEKDLTFRLRSVKKEDFKDYDYFEYGLIIGTPEKDFWTKDGKVSKTSIDFDAHKVFTDVIAKELDFNDGQICFAPIQKIPVKGQYWIFGVSIKAMKGKDVLQTYEWHDFIEKLSAEGFQIL